MGSPSTHLFGEKSAARPTEDKREAQEEDAE
jgi:hypothetical protein